MKPSDPAIPVSGSQAFKLLNGEEVFRIQHVPNTLKKLQKPSPLTEIYRLTASTSEEDIGLNGPSIAALPYDGEQDKSEHQGIYSVVFGRDSLRVAIDLAEYYPKLAEATIVRLAELQGVKYDDLREEEPGRIVHEARTLDDAIAKQLTTDRGWGWPYYASVDATPEFVRTLSRYCKLHRESHYDFLLLRYTDMDGSERTIADALRRAVEWIERRLAANKEGIIEFKSALPPLSPLSPRGLENQVWKDSWDAYHHADGTIANHKKPISSIEVQVTAYDALIDAAELYEGVLSDLEYAGKLRKLAERLSKTIHKHYWCDEKGGYFVLGTDRDSSGKLRQLRVRTSNMGHVLNSRFLEGDDETAVDRRNRVLKHLKSAELLAAGGIRTLASDELRYREGSYHNGSVWIWDTHHIAKGLRRHAGQRFKDFASELDRRILRAIDEIGGFPEYVRGSADTISVNEYVIDLVDSTNGGRLNRIEQPPQQVQAWTVAAILATKKRLERTESSQ